MLVDASKLNIITTKLGTEGAASMKLLSKFIIGLGIPLCSCTNSGTAVEARIAENLKVIVHPVQEDAKGYRQAAKICSCAAQKAVSAWSTERTNKFDRELADYSLSIQKYTDQFNVSNLLSQQPDEYPSPSETLSQELTEFSDFIAECEEKIGGRGVEF